MALFGPPNVEKLKNKGDVSGLTSALRHRDASTRGEAARALGELGEARAVEPLAAASRDGAVEVRRASAEALGAVGDQRAVAPLNDLLKEEDRQAAEWAREALGDAIGAGPRTLEQFVQGVHRERGVRQAALHALEQIGGPEAERVLAEYRTARA